VRPAMLCATLFARYAPQTGSSGAMAVIQRYGWYILGALGGLALLLIILLAVLICVPSQVGQDRTACRLPAGCLQHKPHHPAHGGAALRLGLLAVHGGVPSRPCAPADGGAGGG